MVACGVHNTTVLFNLVPHFSGQLMQHCLILAAIIVCPLFNSISLTKFFNTIIILYINIVAENYWSKIDYQLTFCGLIDMSRLL